MPESAMYVYGIVPADVETEPAARGVGDPAAEVKTVRHGKVAALVSRIDPSKPLGRPQDLSAHAALLDGASVACPVLPLRFGAVLTDEQSVIDELLAEHEDEFAEALHELEGKAEFVLRGRYDESAVLTEILDENPELVQLREAIRDKPEAATRDERIALGERINNAIAAKRQADTDALARTLTQRGVLVNVREPTHEEDAFNIACLTETAKQADLEAAVDQVAKQWEGRVEVRLLGPLAPYDFVVTRTGT